MNDDNEKEILSLILNLDFTKAGYNEYDVETDELGAIKHSHTAVFDFENPINSKWLTIEIKVDNIDELAYIKKVNGMNVDITIDYGVYCAMEIASKRGMVLKVKKILEDYKK